MVRLVLQVMKYSAIQMCLFFLFPILAGTLACLWFAGASVSTGYVITSEFVLFPVLAGTLVCLWFASASTSTGYVITSDFVKPQQRAFTSGIISFFDGAITIVGNVSSGTVDNIQLILV